MRVFSSMNLSFFMKKVQIQISVLVFCLILTALAGSSMLKTENIQLLPENHTSKLLQYKIIMRNEIYPLKNLVFCDTI